MVWNLEHDFIHRKSLFYHNKTRDSGIGDYAPIPESEYQNQIQ